MECEIGDTPCSDLDVKNLQRKCPLAQVASLHGSTVGNLPTIFGIFSGYEQALSPLPGGDILFVI